MYTTDGDDLKHLNRGKIPNVYATVDFGLGKDASKAFSEQRKVEPHGILKILYCSRLYTIKSQIEYKFILYFLNKQ